LLARSYSIVHDLVPELARNLADAETITAVVLHQIAISAAEARVSVQWQERVWLLLALELELELLRMKSAATVIVAVIEAVIGMITMTTTIVQDALEVKEGMYTGIRVIPTLGEV
jgi:hypothetical protein